jgi:hypothetical protein
VTGTWSYDYAGEERKRFRGLSNWIPRSELVSDFELNEYLKRVAFLWPSKTGMNEEIALKLLMQKSYQVK